MSKEGLVGNVYEIEIAHTQWVGETRKHNEDPDKCWCWKEYDKRIGKSAKSKTKDKER